MIIYVFFGVLSAWLVVLSVIVFKLKNHYYNLISSTKKEKLDDILDWLIKTDKKNEIEIIELKKQLEQEISLSKLHIQKIGLVRFNPFERLGGEQSFVVALSDQEKNGLLLNFIYTKEGLRVYTKRVKKGKGEEYELSVEEQKAMERSS